MSATAVIGAMAVEVRGLVKALESQSELDLGIAKAWRGELSGADVVVAESGVGKVAAAALTQALIDALPVAAVVNTGVAGALDPTLAVGDLVIATKVSHHDVDVSALGYEAGKLPGFPRWFAADRAMVGAFARGAAATGYEGAVRTGAIASGDQFVMDAEARARVREATGALCCDMEGAAIGQVASMNRVPFCVVRAISDGADGVRRLDYARFERLAARRTMALVGAVLAG